LIPRTFRIRQDAHDETTTMTAADPSYRSPILGNDDYRTFANLMAGAKATFPEKEAYVFGTERLTFGQWYDEALSLASALQARGVKPGDVVLILLDTSIDYAICFAAIQFAGAVGSGVNTRLGRREIGAIIQRSEPALLFAENGVEIPGEVPAVIRRSELAELYRAAPPTSLPQRAASDPAVIIWTSGTTGMPKGATLDHNNLKAATVTSGPMAAPFARRLNSTPFAHAGYNGKVWEHVAFGMATVVSETPWTAKRMLQLLVDERISIPSGVPTQWAKLLDLPELATADLSYMTVGITATAPAPPELIERVSKALGIPLIVRYSMTECPSMTGTRIGDSPETLYRTVGRPQPHVELAIVDENSLAPVPHGAVGRIRVRSPQVMRGYWRDPERTAEVLSDDGWMLTGDYARFDDNGNVVLAGRASEMYIRGGYNVYPIEVERVISEHPGVVTVAVIGKKTPVIGEIGVAFVVPVDPASPPSLEDLRAAVKAELADYKAPDELHIVDALPLTSVMKVDKLALHARLAEAGADHAAA
jgi:acyl-CoA synthetase (AMP-forming)/AMP-acid ligase II